MICYSLIKIILGLVQTAFVLVYPSLNITRLQGGHVTNRQVIHLALAVQTLTWPYSAAVDIAGYLLISINGCRGVNKLYVWPGGTVYPYSFCIPMSLATGTGTFSYYAQSNIDDTVFIPSQRHHPFWR